MFNEQDSVAKNGVSGTMSMVDWLKFLSLSLLACVPVVGSIAYIIIYIYMMAKPNLNINLKNYMKAQLIFAGVMLIIGLVIGVLCASVLSRGAIQG